MIEQTCEKCGLQMQIPDKFAGTTGRCKRCGAPVHVVGTAFDVDPDAYTRGAARIDSSESPHWWNLSLRNAIGIVLIIAALPFLYSIGHEAMEEAGMGDLSPVRFAPSKTVTYSDYMQIKNGMSYSQVVGIVGSQGKEMSRNHMDGVPGFMDSIETVGYMWQNGDGSNLLVVFQNDRVVQKNQAFLD